MLQSTFGRRLPTIVDATSTLCKSTSTLFDAVDDRRRSNDRMSNNVDDWRQTSTPKKKRRRGVDDRHLVRSSIIVDLIVDAQ